MHIAVKKFKSTHTMTALVFVLVLACLAGCSKKEFDPVASVKAQIPEIAKAINSRDLDALKDMGTDRFDPERFMDDMYRHGVRGDVSLALKRVRYVPHEAKMVVKASFGPDGSGGVKELTINFVGENEMKMDTYLLKDETLPPPLEEDILKQTPTDTSKADAS